MTNRQNEAAGTPNAFGSPPDSASQPVAVRKPPQGLAPELEPVVAALVQSSSLCGLVPLDPPSVAGLEGHTARLVQLITHAREDGDQTLVRSLCRELLVVRYELVRARREAAVLGTRPGMDDPSRGG